MKPLNLFHDLLKTNSLGRLLGLDVGDKYVGLAVSDSQNKIASPLRYVPIKRSTFTKITMLIIFSVRFLA